MDARDREWFRQTNGSTPINGRCNRSVRGIRVEYRMCAKGYAATMLRKGCRDLSCTAFVARHLRTADHLLHARDRVHGN
ncbi:MAG: hypothetical protein ACREPF_11785, partial [Rhodanobacteraceae bacterium]